MVMRDIRVFEDREALSCGVAECLARRIREVTDSARPFGLVLSGGATPRRVLELLATDEAISARWPLVHLFWSDERYVPRDHPDSNYRMAHEALISRVLMPHDNLHVPATDLARPEDAASRYVQAIRAFFGGRSPRFDWVFLGLGEDGHIASLFPEGEASHELRWVCAVHGSPKPPSRRLTMTLALLNQAAELHVLVAGAQKAEVLQATLEGPHAPRRRPAQALAPVEGTVTWWVDAAAAGRLTARP